MATEDFETYTEEDEGGDILVESATLISVTTMRQDANSYVRSPSKGAGHFGDFEHLIKLTWTDRTDGANNECGLWAVNNGAFTLGDMDTANAGMAVLLYTSPTWHDYIYLHDFTNDNSDDYDIGVDQLPKTYWLTIKRASTTLTCKIYSDASRETLLDTLTLTCGETTYEYVSAVANYEAGGAAKVTFSVEDLDLQEEAPPEGAIPVMMRYFRNMRES